ncbi:calcium/calmodulin-dependent protein kinase type IV [Reticulomyxa filosa]|uniref:Calcium/calmodulin-dependent protein kinase type IV n=1 Tax=Reticulomyxa filosa TaxID=46433 RepID=X6P332_RETFI|nr:calcium/calmodulin-dependent protein kinase type IV [Reticulomyxa filosa]|eukprot:ETO32636.1 calcium/calmodulin-dependent protein kinase type IV [Reticulomyxa filosa]
MLFLSISKAKIAKREQGPMCTKKKTNKARQMTTNSAHSSTDEFNGLIKSENYVKDITDLFELTRTLGKGASCEVFEAKSKENGFLYALKRMHLTDKENKERFKTEVSILTALRHKTVVKLKKKSIIFPKKSLLKKMLVVIKYRFHNSYSDGKNLYICCKLCGGGALLGMFGNNFGSSKTNKQTNKQTKDRIRKSHVFSEDMAAKMLKTLIQTMKFVHTNDVVHRDLKPGNLMFDSEDEDANLVLIDFGDAMRLTDNASYTSTFGTCTHTNIYKYIYICIYVLFIFYVYRIRIKLLIFFFFKCLISINTYTYTCIFVCLFMRCFVIIQKVLYLPPEVGRQRYGWEMKKSDMWSVGVIAYILVTGRPPFVGNENEIMKQILMFDDDKPCIDFTFRKNKHKLSVQCKDFIRKLLTRNTTQRLSAANALLHPFILHSQSTVHLGDDLLHDLGKFQDAGLYVYTCICTYIYIYILYVSFEERTNNKMALL